MSKKSSAIIFNECAKIHALKDAGIRNPFLVYLALLGLPEMENRFGGMDKFKKVMQEIISPNLVLKYIDGLKQSLLIAGKAEPSKGLAHDFVVLREAILNAFERSITEKA